MMESGDWVQGQSDKKTTHIQSIIIQIMPCESVGVWSQVNVWDDNEKV